MLVGPPALSDEVGDWFTSGDQDHRAAYTKAKTSTATETMLIYQCINNINECSFRLQIEEDCSEGEKIPITIQTDPHLHQTLSTCTKLFSRSKSKASIIFKELGPTLETLGSLTKTTITINKYPLSIEYKASLVGASQSIIYVNGIHPD